MKLLTCIFLLTTSFIFAQSKAKVTTTESLKPSAAYAEVLFRKVEVEAELEDLLVIYTENHTKVLQLKLEAEKLSRELEKLFSLDSSKFQRMSSALGKLIIRVQTEVDLWLLLQKHTEEDELVKRARRKLLAFENAIREILETK